MNKPVNIGVGIVGDQILVQMITLGGALTLSALLTADEARGFARTIEAHADKLDGERRVVRGIILGNGNDAFGPGEYPH
jgi:hypothetical protein